MSPANCTVILVRPGAMLWHDWLLQNGWTPVNPGNLDTYRHEWQDVDGRIYDFYTARDIQARRDGEA
jgi:hypothetical protein